MMFCKKFEESDHGKLKPRAVGKNPGIPIFCVIFLEKITANNF